MPIYIDYASPTNGVGTELDPKNTHVGITWPADGIRIKCGNEPAAFTSAISVGASGSAGAPLIVGSYGEGARPKLTFTGTASGININARNYVRVADLDIDVSGSTGSGIFGQGGSSNIEVLGSYILAGSGSCVGLQASSASAFSNWKIRNNWLRGGLAGVRFLASVDALTHTGFDISDNLIEEMTEEGIRLSVEAGYVTTTINGFRANRNIITLCGGMSIYLRAVYASTADNTAPALWGSGCVIGNNNVSLCGTTTKSGAIHVLGSQDGRIYRNYVRNVYTAGAMIQGQRRRRFVIHDNDLAFATPISPDFIDGCGIFADRFDNDIRILRNKIADCPGVEGVSNSGAGISVWMAENIIAEANEIQRCKYLAHVGGNSNKTTTGVKIRRNTGVDIAVAGYWGDVDGVGVTSTSVEYVNNLLVNAPTGIKTNLGPMTVCNGNGFINVTTPYDGQTPGLLDRVVAATDLREDYTPRPGSLLIKGGVNLGVFRDITGGQGKPTTIGCRSYKLAYRARTSLPSPPAGYPASFLRNTTWNITGLTHIEAIHNLWVYVPELGRQVTFSIALPAGYTGGTDTYPVVLNSHGAQNYPTTGPGYADTTWPAAYNDAIANGSVRPHITVLTHLGEHSMGTDQPGGAVMAETYVIALMNHVHANFRTKGKLPKWNALMGFSMGARASMYWLFKYAKLFHDGLSDIAWGGAAVFGGPVYSPTHDYENDNSTQVTAWKIPCISPDGAWTPEQLAVWGDKCAQSWIDLAALADVLICMGYGAGDSVRSAAGVDWNADLNAAGVTHEYITGLLQDGGANIQHNSAHYWGATNVTRSFYAKIETVFARDEVTFDQSTTYGIYCLDNAQNQTGSPTNSRDRNILGLADYMEWLSGYAWRQQWNWLHTGAGTYNFASITHIMAKLDEEDPSGRLKLSLLIANIADNAVDSAEPQYIYDGAAAEFRWTSPNGDRCVPWYSGLQTAWSQFMTALANFEVFDINTGTMVALKDHSRFAKINVSVPGWGPMREIGIEISTGLPGYTRTLFTQAAVDAFGATIAAFPNRRVSTTLNNMTDATPSPTLSAHLRSTLFTAYASDLEWFHDAMSGSWTGAGGTGTFTGRPLTSFVSDLYAACPTQANETDVCMQALTNSQNATNANVANSMAWHWVDYVWTTFGCRYVEIYGPDIDRTENHADFARLSELMWAG